MDYNGEAFCLNCNDKGCDYCGPDTNDGVSELMDYLDDEFGAHDFEDSYEDDGQPSEYDEWQDYFGGDDWDHGQYDTDDW